MTIVKQHFSAFSRLIHESVRIDRSSRDNSISILNLKSEWGSNKLPRLVIEKDENVDSGKGKEMDQHMKDFDTDDKMKGSFSDSGQVRFQSFNSNKKLLNYWTPSTSAARKPSFRQTNQLTLHNYFRDKVK